MSTASDPFSPTGIVQTVALPSPSTLRQYLESLRTTLLAGLIQDEMPFNPVPAPSLGLQLAESILIPRMMQGRATTGGLRPMQRPTVAAKGPHSGPSSITLPLPPFSEGEERADDGDEPVARGETPRSSIDDIEEVEVIKKPRPKRKPKEKSKDKSKDRSAVKEGRAATWKKPWSDEEHRLLKRLMVEYPPEENRRWIKISEAMGGTRTSRQVASRVQKCFGQLRGSRLDPDDLSGGSE